MSTKVPEVISVANNNSLAVDLIKPSLGAEYSPNLYRWLTIRERPWRANRSQVLADKDGTLWIGEQDDHWFTGCWLNSVLCNGVKAETGAYPGLGLKLRLITDFWLRYIRDGRCAIDVDHKALFIGDETRWESHGDTRRCTWCGNTSQVLKRWTETDRAV
ncbi:hypothetical protein LP417_35670 (plasmid) [Polaromonas sp. P1-6]|nr:hypothetical protein LP417_35670 [Polaromonas sp. P1-6]